VFFLSGEGVGVKPSPNLLTFFPKNFILNLNLIAPTGPTHKGRARCNSFIRVLAGAFVYRNLFPPLSNGVLPFERGRVRVGAIGLPIYVPVSFFTFPLYLP
jgi:hypothetical protein